MAISLFPWTKSILSQGSHTHIHPHLQGTGQASRLRPTANRLAISRIMARVGVVIPPGLRHSSMHQAGFVGSRSLLAQHHSTSFRPILACETSLQILTVCTDSAAYLPWAMSFLLLSLNPSVLCQCCVSSALDTIIALSMLTFI